VCLILVEYEALLPIKTYDIFVTFYKTDLVRHFYKIPKFAAHNILWSDFVILNSLNNFINILIILTCYSVYTRQNMERERIMIIKRSVIVV